MGEAGAFRETMGDYNAVKERLRIRLIRKENSGQRIMSLGAAVVYVSPGDKEGREWGLRVSNEMVRQYGISDDELFEEAMAQTMLHNPLVFQPLESRIGESTGKPPGQDTGQPSRLYILSNQTGCLGAAATLYPEAMEKIRQVLGEDYYILPSTIHELLIARKSEAHKPCDLRRMVREANRDNVSQKERLSDGVFEYRGKEGRIVQCRTSGKDLGDSR